MIAEARIAITGARSAPCRLPEVEAAVRERPVPGPGDRHLARLAGRALGPLFLSESVPYKRTLAGLMTVEALAAAGAEARGRP
jgi:CO/xanthine dehydrogenase FAD-binding subunit